MASRKPSHRRRQPHLREGIPNFTPKPTRAVPAPMHCPSSRAWILSTPPASRPSLLSLEWVVEPLSCSPASTHSKLGFHPLPKKPRKAPIPGSVKIVFFQTPRGVRFPESHPTEIRGSQWPSAALTPSSSSYTPLSAGCAFSLQQPPPQSLSVGSQWTLLDRTGPHSALDSPSCLPR